MSFFNLKSCFSIPSFQKGKGIFLVAYGLACAACGGAAGIYRSAVNFYFKKNNCLNFRERIKIALQSAA